METVPICDYIQETSIQIPEISFENELFKQ